MENNSATATMTAVAATTIPKTAAVPEAVIVIDKFAAEEKKVVSKKSAAVATIAAKPPRVRSGHPSAAIMVRAAIRTLQERNGSSVQAIKKYIAATYKIDSDKFAPFIKKSLKSCVISGKLVQTKGKGASGSFKLPILAAIVGSTKSSTAKMATKVKKIEASKKKKKSAVAAVSKKVIVPKRIGGARKMAKKEVLEKKKRMLEEEKEREKKKKEKEEKKEKKMMMKTVKIKGLGKSASKKAPTASPKAPKPKKVSLLLGGKTLGRTPGLLKKRLIVSRQC